jgi:hypothetical protein
MIVLPVYYHNSEILNHNLEEKSLSNNTNTSSLSNDSFLNKSNEKIGFIFSNYFNSISELIKFWSSIDFKYEF